MDKEDYKKCLEFTKMFETDEKFREEWLYAHDGNDSFYRQCKDDVVYYILEHYEE